MTFLSEGLRRDYTSALEFLKPAYVLDPRRNGHQKEPKALQKEPRYAAKGNDGFKKGRQVVPFLPKCVLLSDSGDIADQYWISGLVVETITASIIAGMIAQMQKPARE